MLLEIKNLTKTFGGLTALNNVNMAIQQGEIRGLIGPNGSGKTTLLNVITGFYKAGKGHIIYEGKEITNKRPDEIARMGIVRTFQNINLFSQMTVIENVLTAQFSKMTYGLGEVLCGSKRVRIEEEKAVDKANQVLAFVGLAGFEKARAGSLPYGQQRLLEIARALVLDPYILLLDEPVAGMNEQESMEVVDLLRKLKARGITVLLIEHHMRFVMEVCERITVLNSGVIIAEGVPAEIQQNEDVIRAYLGRGLKYAKSS